MDERPLKETIRDDQQQPSSPAPSLPQPQHLNAASSMAPQPFHPQSSLFSASQPSLASQQHMFQTQHELRSPRTPSSPSSNPASSVFLPLDALSFAKRPVPPLRQQTSPLPSPLIKSRASSFSSASQQGLGIVAGDDGLPSLFPPPQPRPGPIDNNSSPSLPPTFPIPHFQPISLLSQILVTNSVKLSALGGGSALVSSPLSSNASSPVGAGSAQLHGIFRRRGSAGTMEMLDKVGEEEPEGEGGHTVQGQLNIPLSTYTMAPHSSILASPMVSPRTTAASSPASSLSRILLSPPPSSPTKPRAPSRLIFSEPERTSTSTPDLHSSPEALSSPVLASPLALAAEIVLPKKATGLVFVEDPEILSRRLISTAPPSPTQPAIPPPQKKPSNLTFAVSSVCARPPPTLGKTPGRDGQMDDDDDDLDDAELNSEEDEEDDENSIDSQGYEEDDEEEESSEDDDEEGVSSSPAERRKYRYKRHSLFGDSDTDEDEDEEEDGFGGEDEDEDGSLRTRKSARDSILSNFSFDKALGESPKLVIESSLRHRRSASLQRRSGTVALSARPSPSSTSTSPQASSSAMPNKLATNRRTHFPTPLVLRPDHSAFPRSPVPRSLVRGGAGYSPRVKRGTRMAAGVQQSSAAKLGRDDFLPTHLKSEEGKERERERERERDSTTDQGGGVSSGRCSRHRSPPPSSSGRDKMRAHGERRSRSVVAWTRGDNASSSSRSRRTSADPTHKILSQQHVPPPSPVFKQPSSTTVRGILAPSAPGDLTPVFLTDAEDPHSSARPPSAYRPTLVAPTVITTSTATLLPSPPPSRRESTSAERRASLSAVCSVFQPAVLSDDPFSCNNAAQSRRRPSIAIDGSSSAPYTQRSAGGTAASFVDERALTQSLQKVLLTNPPSGRERSASVSVRPWSPPATAPSSFVAARYTPPTQFVPTASVPERRGGVGKRRMSTPAVPSAINGGGVAARPIAVPMAVKVEGVGGGWTDGG